VTEVVDDSERRSAIMRCVKSVDTFPERKVRSLVHAMGFRFRLHRQDLPGKPDLVFPSRHKVVFVHGCFWHGHGCKRGARVPRANREYWECKIAANVARDSDHQVRLRSMDWTNLVVWECELRDLDELRRKLAAFLTCSSEEEAPHPAAACPTQTATGEQHQLPAD